MEPLRVIAHLATAYSAPDPWSPSLDGILAYWELFDQLGADAMAERNDPDNLIDPDLPLHRIEYGGDWWWACSSPLVDDDAIRFHSWFHRRFDDHEAVDRVDERVRKVLVAAGPHKNFRHRRNRIMPRNGELVWHCVGDASAIERLLRRCQHVGFGHTRGYGLVRHWEVTAVGADPDLAQFHRPVPDAYAIEHGLTGVGMPWGIRPPGRALAHQRDCVMPV